MQITSTGYSAFTSLVSSNTQKQGAQQFLFTLDTSSGSGTSNSITSSNPLPSSSNSQTSDTSQSSGSGSSVINQFMAYMKETPAQQMEDAWLGQHGITKQQFDAMSPEEKAKILAQMKKDIEEKLQKQADTPKKQSLNIEA